EGQVSATSLAGPYAGSCWISASQPSPESGVWRKHLHVFVRTRVNRAATSDDRVAQVSITPPELAAGNPAVSVRIPAGAAADSGNGQYEGTMRLLGLADDSLAIEVPVRAWMKAGKLLLFDDGRLLGHHAYVALRAGETATVAFTPGYEIWGTRV